MDLEVTMNAASLFMLRFGVGGPRAGRGYVRRILTVLEENEVCDYKECIRRVAKEQYVTTDTIMAAVARWLRHTWENEYLKEIWLTVVGAEDTEKAPAPREAIQQICDAYLAWRK